MAKITTPYTPLLNVFDGIGWIPTIRGGLTLDILESPNVIGSEVDNYFVEFKNYTDLEASRYLLASTLTSIEDSKSGSVNCRTFRFIFRASINDKKKQEEFIDIKLKNKIRASKTLFKQKELLIGKLSIVVYEKNELTINEIDLIKGLKNILKEKEKYNKAYIKGDSLDDLENKRKKLKGFWDTIEAEIMEIENKTEGNPIFKFDIVLSRDGIFFIKDDTDAAFHDYYFTKGTAEDYTKYIPMHRVFKMAMIYIKNLFHKDDYHDAKHDTFLPISNLHPIRSDENIDKIIKHQLESFQNPVTTLKRDFKKRKWGSDCDPKGILQYAESFLKIFHINGLIDNEKAEILLKSIETQKKDIEVISHDINTVRNAFLSQKNFLASALIGTTFLVASIHFFNFVYKDFMPTDIGQKDLFSLHRAIAFAAVLVGFVCHRWNVFKYTRVKSDAKVEWPLITKLFTKIKRLIFLRDSNLKRKKLSRAYSFYQILVDWRIWVKKMPLNILILIVLLEILYILIRLSLYVNSLISIHY